MVTQILKKYCKTYGKQYSHEYGTTYESRPVIPDHRPPGVTQFIILGKPSNWFLPSKILPDRVHSTRKMISKSTRIFLSPILFLVKTTCFRRSPEVTKLLVHF